MANEYQQRYSADDSSTAGNFHFDEDEAGKDIGVSKVVFGADGAAITRVTASVGLPVQLLAGTAAVGKLAANDGVDIGDVTINNASLAVTGTFWQATQPVSIAAAVGVTDNAGSLTVDAPVGTPVFVRLSDGTDPIATLPVSLASVPSHAVTNAGTFAVQLSQYTPASGRLPVDGSGVTQPVSGTVTANAGTGSFTVAQATAANLNATVVGTGTFVVQATLAAETTKVIGTVNVSAGQSIAVTNAGTFAVQASVPAVTTGGATPGKLTSAGSTNATSVKGSAGTLYMLVAMNTNAAARYLKLYNKATAPTVGTDTPVLTFTIPGNTAGAGFVCPIPTQGIEFSTGIAFALTTGAADSDTGAVAANEINVNYGYK